MKNVGSKENIMNKEYIHYGHKHFDRNAFVPIQNGKEVLPKPIGGLWASPADAKFGWKEWCESENFRECEKEDSFSFTLKKNAKVAHIFSNYDLNQLPQRSLDFISSFTSWVLLDFEKMLQDGIDALELHLSASQNRDYNDGNDLYFLLYGWDCDSILVMNPDIILPIEK